MLATPGAMGTNQAGESVQFPIFIDDYDIFFPYERILISVLTQNMPGVDFQPNDPSVSEDIDGAEAAESYSQLFDRMNDVKQIMIDQARMFGLSGRCVSWTRTEEDEQRFGYEDDGTTPRRFQKTDIFGTLETKVPIMCKNFDRNCPYVFIYQDLDINILKDRHPDFKDKIRAGASGLGENSYERTARLGVLNGTLAQAQIGDSLSNLATKGHFFLRPSAFMSQIYENAFDEDPSMTLGEACNQIFPEGVRACFIGDAYVGSYPESVDDHIEIRWPFAGDGMFRPGFMDPMVVVSDTFNDNMNAAREKFDTGWGSLWINGDDLDIDAITSQRAAPNAIRARKARQGQSLEQEFFKEADPDLPATFVQFIQMIQSELPQFKIGRASCRERVEISV